MRPVEMDRIGMLAAAMYAILDDRRFKDLLNGFSVLVELVPGLANDEVLFGSRISGYIQIDSIHRREFVIQFTYDGDYGDINVEVSYKTEYYRDKSVACIDHDGPIEIDFDKRSVTYKRVEIFNTKNVAWDWMATKGTAADIIGMILNEKNS